MRKLSQFFYYAKSDQFGWAASLFDYRLGIKSLKNPCFQYSYSYKYESKLRASEKQNYWMRESLYDDQQNNFVCPCILFALSIPTTRPQSIRHSIGWLGWVYQSLCSYIGLQIHSQTGWDINILWLSKRTPSTAAKCPSPKPQLHLEFNTLSCGVWVVGPGRVAGWLAGWLADWLVWSSLGQCVMETWLNSAKICAAHKCQARPS